MSSVVSIVVFTVERTAVSIVVFTVESTAVSIVVFTVERTAVSIVVFTVESTAVSIVVFTVESSAVCTVVSTIVRAAMYSNKARQTILTYFNVFVLAVIFPPVVSSGTGVTFSVNGYYLVLDQQNLTKLMQCFDQTTFYCTIKTKLSGTNLTAVDILRNLTLSTAGTDSSNVTFSDYMKCVAPSQTITQQILCNRVLSAASSQLDNDVKQCHGLKLLSNETVSKQYKVLFYDNGYIIESNIHDVNASLIVASPCLELSSTISQQRETSSTDGSLNVFVTSPITVNPTPLITGELSTTMFSSFTLFTGDYVSYTPEQSRQGNMTTSLVASSIYLPLSIASSPHVSEVRSITSLTVIVSSITVQSAISEMSSTTVQSPISEMSSTTVQSPISEMSSTTVQSPISEMSSTTVQSPISEMSSTTVQSPISEMSSTTGQSPITEMSSTTVQSPISEMSSTTVQSPISEMSSTTVQSPISEMSSTTVQSPISEMSSTTVQSPIYEMSSTTIHSLMSEMSSRSPSTVSLVSSLSPIPGLILSSGTSWMLSYVATSQYPSLTSFTVAPDLYLSSSDLETHSLNSATTFTETLNPPITAPDPSTSTTVTAVQTTTPTATSSTVTEVGTVEPSEASTTVTSSQIALFKTTPSPSAAPTTFTLSQFASFNKTPTDTLIDMLSLSEIDRSLNSLISETLDTPRVNTLTEVMTTTETVVDLLTWLIPATVTNLFTTPQSNVLIETYITKLTQSPTSTLIETFTPSPTSTLNETLTPSPTNTMIETLTSSPTTRFVESLIITYLEPSLPVATLSLYDSVLTSQSSTHLTNIATFSPIPSPDFIEASQSTTVELYATKIVSGELNTSLELLISTYQSTAMVHSDVIVSTRGDPVALESIAQGTDFVSFALTSEQAVTLPVISSVTSSVNLYVTNPISSSEPTVTSSATNPISTSEQTVTSTVINPISSSEPTATSSVTNPISTSEQTVISSVTNPVTTSEQTVTSYATNPISTSEQTITSFVTIPISTSEQSEASSATNKIVTPDDTDTSSVTTSKLASPQTVTPNVTTQILPSYWTFHTSLQTEIGQTADFTSMSSEPNPVLLGDSTNGYQLSETPVTFHPTSTLVIALTDMNISLTSSTGIHGDVSGSQYPKTTHVNFASFLSQTETYTIFEDVLSRQTAAVTEDNSLSESTAYVNIDLTVSERNPVTSADNPQFESTPPLLTISSHLEIHSTISATYGTTFGLTTQMTTISSSQTVTNSSGAGPTSKNTSAETERIIGITLGVLGFAAVLILVAFLVRNRNSLKWKRDDFPVDNPSHYSC
ncbi:hypothetical protein Btru_055696 [Bulinus truncatus]|nr:hypothetical protein Btru_055696 [Bulinus truncatus]